MDILVQLQHTEADTATLNLVVVPTDVIVAGRVEANRKPECTQTQQK